jgi:pimeloyl-ACP methyl ester carboxylesterase
MRRRTILTAAASGTVAAIGLPQAAQANDVTVREGELNGARYRVEVPANWNGNLALWSRAPIYTARPDQPVEVASDPLTGQWLLRNGFALAASNYRTPSSAAFDEALEDQLALLAHVRPKRTIAWGTSGGGLMSVLLAEQHPGLLHGALPLCGVLAGLAGVLDLALDYATALTVLFGRTDLPVTGITDPFCTKQAVDELIESALITPAGRARLALASALADIPGWAKALRPKPGGLNGQIEAQAAYGQLGFSTFWTVLRADLEQRAGGNPSGNVGVDYHRQFYRSSQFELTRYAYWDANLDLQADLDQLAVAPRVAAGDGAAQWLHRLTPKGRAAVPILALHSTGDGLAAPEHTSAYGRGPHFRSVFTERGGHGCYTSSELITGFKVLRGRIVTGYWPSLVPQSLNRQAIELGPEYQIAPDWGDTFQPLPARPAFIRHTPRSWPRAVPRDIASR